MPGILEKHIFLADSAEELEGSCRQQARTRRPWAADAFAHHTSPRAPATGPVHLLCSLPGARYPCLSTWWAPVLRHSCLGSNAPSQRPSLAMLATAVPPHAHDPPASLLHSARWHKKLTSLRRAPSWEAQPGTPRGRLLQCGGDETGQVERHRTERGRSDPPPSTMPRSCTQGPVTEAGPSRGTRTRPDALGGWRPEPRAVPSARPVLIASARRKQPVGNTALAQRGSEPGPGRDPQAGDPQPKEDAPTCRPPRALV